MVSIYYMETLPCLGVVLTLNGPRNPFERAKTPTYYALHDASIDRGRSLFVHSTQIMVLMHLQVFKSQL